MSLKDILELEKSRLNREHATYKTVYERMKNRINFTVKTGEKICFYEIPDFIVGYPLINIEKTMIYLQNKLSKEGFVHIKIDERRLLITWNPKHLKELDKHIKEEEKKKTLNYTEKLQERNEDDFIKMLISSKNKQ